MSEVFRVYIRGTGRKPVDSILFFRYDNLVSKINHRSCKCRKTAGEESPGFAGQDAG